MLNYTRGIIKYKIALFTLKLFYYSYYMNFHLIFVHFPIALFTIYALLELISINKINQLSYWFFIKAVLVIIGSISAYFTLETGSLIEGKFSYLHDLVNVHSDWATISTIIFSLIAAAYGIAWINREWHFDLRQTGLFSGIWGSATVISKFILKRLIVFILALAGLIAITITGALGGAISQGPTIDPVVNFVYHLYFTK